MQFCKHHWDLLHSEIEKAGMGHLVARTGDKAITRLQSELDGTATTETFDPLMAAHNEILRRFLEPLGASGLYVFSGDYCPLCELVRMSPRPENEEQLDVNWVRGVVGDMREFCKELLPRIN